MNSLSSSKEIILKPSPLQDLTESNWKDIHETDKYWKIFYKEITEFEENIRKKPLPEHTYKQYVGQVKKFHSVHSPYQIIKGIANHPKAKPQEFFHIEGNRVYVFPSGETHLLKADNPPTETVLSEEKKPKIRVFTDKVNQDTGDQSLIRIIDLTNGIHLSSINYTENFALECCIGSFITKNSQLITISDFGRLTYWNIQDTSKPQRLSCTLLPNTWVAQAVQYGDYLVLLTKNTEDGYVHMESPYEVRIYETFSLKTVQVLKQNQGEFLQIATDGKVLITIQSKFVKGHVLRGDQLIETWQQPLEDNETVLFMKEIDLNYPYLLCYKKEKNWISNFKVLHAHTGSKVLDKNPPKPICTFKTACSEKGKCSPEEENYKLMKDLVIRITEHEITCWDIFSGYSFFINLPFAAYGKKDKKLSDINAHWDGKYLIIKYPEFFEEQKDSQTTYLLTNTLKIYQTEYQFVTPFPLLDTQHPFELNTAHLKSFISMSAHNSPTDRRGKESHVLIDVQLTFLNTVKKISKLFHLINFQIPDFSFKSFAAKLDSTIHRLTSIALVPLFIIGIQLIAIGLIDIYKELSY